MKHSGDRLQERLKAISMPKSKLAKEMGVLPQHVNNWIKRGIPARHAKKIASIISTSDDWLMDGVGTFIEVNNDSSNVTTIDTGRLIPLISFVQAGGWTECIDNFEPGGADDWLPCPSKHSLSTFALRVQGDSMTSPYPGQKSYPAGTIIFVDPEREAHVGDSVVAKLVNENEATFKVLAEDAGHRFLRPLNPQYPIQQINDDCVIVGKVIGSYFPE